MPRTSEPGKTIRPVPEGYSTVTPWIISGGMAGLIELVERGVEVSEVQELPGGRFVFFSDPDGNRWSVQEISGSRQNV